MEPGPGALACWWQLQLGREEPPVDKALMDQPLFILLPWTVFGIAAGIKLWHLGTGLGRQLGRKTSPNESFRQTLDRIWTQGKDA